MTDTRLVEGFLTNGKVDGLSDAAFRVYTLGLVWSTAQGTDGRLPDRALRYLHPTGTSSAATAELVAAHLWEIDGDTFVIHDYLDYQTPHEQVERARELTRQRKAAQRLRDQDKELAKVTRDGVRDERRDLQGKDRTGTGQAQERTGTNNGTNNGTNADGYTGGSLTEWGADVA